MVQCDAQRAAERVGADNHGPHPQRVGLGGRVRRLHLPLQVIRPAEDLPSGECKRE